MKLVSVQDNNSFSNIKNEGVVLSRENYHMGINKGNLRKTENSKDDSTRKNKSSNKQMSKDSKISKSGSSKKTQKSSSQSLNKKPVI